MRPRSRHFRLLGLLASVLLAACSASQTNPTSNAPGNILPASARSAPLSAASGGETLDAGHFAYLGTPSGVYVVDLGTGSVKTVIPVPPSGGALTGIAIDPSKSKIYYADGVDGIKVIDPKSNRIVRTIALAGATFAVFNPHRGEAYAIAGDSLYVIDTAADRVIRTYRENYPGRPLGRPALDPAGVHLWLTNEAGICVFNVVRRSGEQIVNSALASSGLPIVVGADGSKAYVAGANGPIDVYSATTHRIAGTIALHVYASGDLKVDATGTHLYAGSLYDVDLRSNTVLGTYPTSGFGLSFGTGQRYLYQPGYAGYPQHLLYRLDRSTGRIDTFAYGNSSALTAGNGFGNFIL